MRSRCVLLRAGHHALLAAAAAVGAPGCAPGAPDGGAGTLVALGEPTLATQASGTEALLQAVSPVSPDVVWASGHEGVVLRSTNGGSGWAAVATPVGDSLQFRDVHGFSAGEAAVLTAGSGSDSRLYHTADGGETWTLAYLMDDERGFLDCLDFWDDRGIAYGDSFDGIPFVLRSTDRGRTWARLGPTALPAALEGEGGFAASGTCARVGPGGAGWIATGAGGAARVLWTEDFGANWQAADVPVVRGQAAGLTTVSFRDGETGVALGGDLEQMDAPTANAARTSDGGRTWTASTAPGFPGPVYGSAWVPGTDGVFVVGPSGAAWSRDGGSSWMPLDTVSYWAVGFAAAQTGWMVGPGGRVTGVTFRR